MNSVIHKIANRVPSGMKERIKDVLNARRNQQMLARHRRRKPDRKKELLDGVNLIGDIRAETGLGQSMRLLASALQKSGIPFVVVEVVSAKGKQLARDNAQWEHKMTAEPVYRINLIHINADDWAESYLMMPEAFFDGRYTIAYWLWELEEFPKRWIPCIDTVDEIWAPSDFICNALRKCSSKPIHCIPYEISLQMPVLYGRDYFGLEENAFYVLCMYDHKSVSERKNPDGMIKAFRQAFTPEHANNHKIGLILKINHAGPAEQLKRLQEQLKDYNHVVYLTENMNRAEVESLMAAADVYLSLHRSEGFGLPVAEAMFLGTAVVATNWSAPTEFMDAETVCPVPYSMIALDRQIGPYPKGAEWADADVQQAAAYLRKLYEDKDFRENMVRRAAQSIRKKLNGDLIGSKIEKRIRIILERGEISS